MKAFGAVTPRLDASPSAWGRVEIRRVATLREEPNAHGDAVLLSLTSAGEVRPRAEDARQQPSADYLLRYWLVEPGDLVVNPMWLIGGAIGVSQVRGAVSPDYRVYRLDPSVHPRYLHHLLRSQPYFDQYKLLVRAETTFDRRITKADFHPIPIVVPPVPTQIALAEYLDAETSRIDSLVAKKRSLISLASEWRQQLVSRAVTVGLNAEATLRPTGNEFAPEIPEGWRLHRLRHVVGEILDTAHKTAPVVDEGRFLVVRTANVKKGRLVLEGARYTDEAGWKEWTERGVPRPGDVMFTREAPAGEACQVPPDLPLCIGQRMVLLRVDPSVVSGEWLVHSIYAGAAQQFIEVLSNSTTVAHLNMSDISDIPIVVPPLDEQESVLTILRRKTAAQEGIVAGLERQIRLLVEHRQALITAAVTGELEIPGAAA
ncbi:MAG: hypothetical protein JWO77_3717 [Ilumatobacteraceae bacterium]|nr:hypothetical protein [Ilumatobacteraceae bacterium]